MNNNLLQFDAQDLVDAWKSSKTPVAAIDVFFDHDADGTPPTRMEIRKTGNKWKDIFDRISHDGFLASVNRINVLDGDYNLITSHSREALRESSMDVNRRMKGAEAIHIKEETIRHNRTSEEVLLDLVIKAQREIVPSIVPPLVEAYKAMQDGQSSFMAEISGMLATMFDSLTARLVTLEDGYREVLSTHKDLIERTVRAEAESMIAAQGDPLQGIAQATMPEIIKGYFAQQTPPSRRAAPAAPAPGSGNLGKILSALDGVDGDALDALLDLLKPEPDTTTPTTAPETGAQE